MPDPSLVDEPHEPRILRAERSFAGAVWDVRRDSFEFGDGELVREYQDHPGAVAVLAIDETDRVLLIKQYRHPIRHRDWELPAGLLDIEGEDPLTTARRELAEEVDLEASEWSLLTQFFSSPGGSSETITVYLARGLSGTPHVFGRTGEEAELELRWVAFGDLLEAVLAGQLRNGILNLAVLHHAADRAASRVADRAADPAADHAGQ